MSRAEAYVQFAQFCKSHDVPPHKIAEVIVLWNDASKTKSYRKAINWRNEVQKRLKDLGFSDIKFRGSPVEPTFVDKHGDTCTLPKFI